MDDLMKLALEAVPVEANTRMHRRVCADRARAIVDRHAEVKRYFDVRFPHGHYCASMICAVRQYVCRKSRAVARCRDIFFGLVRDDVRPAGHTRRHAFTRTCEPKMGRKRREIGHRIDDFPWQRRPMSYQLITCLSSPHWLSWRCHQFHQQILSFCPILGRRRYHRAKMPVEVYRWRDPACSFAANGTSECL